MCRNKISKLKYYINLAIKKPYLVTRFIFKRHIGIILLLPIRNDIHKKNNKNIEFIKTTRDIDEIYKFYKSVKRDSVTRIQIKKWLNKKFDCFLVYGHNSVPIAGMWFFKNKFELVSTSGRTLSNENEIRLDNDTVYGAYVIVDKNYRKNGVNLSLLSFVIKYYSENSNYKKILLITGANNGAYIHSIMKFKGILIGITEVYNIIGLKIRRELFLDIKEKIWNNTK